MINQKGQAFSVFELLIAAIVAVAILFVLLPIVTNIVLPTGDAVTTMANALSSITSSSVDTQTFEIKPKQTILASDISGKGGVDPCAILFSSKPFPETQLKTLSTADIGELSGDMQCTSYLTNLTNTSIRAKAKIVCGTSVASLRASLAASNLNDRLDDSEADLESFWNSGSNEVQDYTKVCVVLLERA